MPTYEYACKSCGKHLEVVQGFNDEALTTCPTCEGPLRKVFGHIAISFKGTGFYSTDNRSVAKAHTATATDGSTGSSKSDSAGSSDSGSGDSSSGGPKPDGKTETKSDTKTESKAAAS